MSINHQQDVGVGMRRPRCYTRVRSVPVDQLRKNMDSDAVLLALGIMLAAATFVVASVSWSL